MLSARRVDSAKLVHWLENESLFFSQVEVGARWAVYVGACFLAYGLKVQVTIPTLRECVDDRFAFTNEGDITVWGHRGTAYLIEAKSRSIAFHSRDDYPYPSAFVDTKRGWDAKTTKPFAVLLVSQPTGSILVVKSEPSEWTELSRLDHVRDIKDVWYAVPRERLREFKRLCEWLGRYG